MKFEMPKLEYSEDALEPYISKETIGYHYGKHTKKYYATASELIKGTVFEKKVNVLEDLINKEGLLKADSALFNNASMAWNHTFYFNSICPSDQSGKPSGAFEKECDRLFDTFEGMQTVFNGKAIAHIGSAWLWLVVRNGDLQVKLTPNAGSVLTEANTTPLLVCDIFEHAYYLDVQNERAKYLENFWKIVNWSVVNERFERTRND